MILVAAVQERNIKSVVLNNKIMKKEVEVTKSEFIEATKGCERMTRGMFGGRYWFRKYENDYFAFQNAQGYFIIK